MTSNSRYLQRPHELPDTARSELELVALPRLLDLLPDYLDHLLGKGHRPKGREKYRTNLCIFIAWLGTDATVADLTEARIEAYRNDRAKSIQPGTVFNELCSVRSLCKWCLHKKRLLREDPTQYVDFPKVPRPSPRALKRDQIKLLFSIIDTEPATHKATWQRNRLALLLFVYTGLRIAEASGLQWKDVDLDVGTITVRPENAKNGRTRAIPIHPRLADELRRLTDQHPDHAVIPSLQATGEPMQPKSIGHIFERWLAKRGLHITAHQLRHSFATELLRSGALLTDIQALLGHDSLETTAVYLSIDAEHLRGAVNGLPAGW